MRDHRSGLLAENDFGPRARSQFAMPADEVRMQMRFDHILDRQTVRGSFVDVLIDVALWINDDCFTIRADQIRSVSETIEIELLEVHAESLSWRLPRRIFAQNSTDRKDLARIERAARE